MARASATAGRRLSACLLLLMCLVTVANARKTPTDEVPSPAPSDGVDRLDAATHRVTNAVLAVCRAPESQGTHWSVTVDSKGSIGLNLKSLEGQSPARLLHFSKEEWSGVQGVLAKDREKDLENYRKCTTDVLSLFLSKIDLSAVSMSSCVSATPEAARLAVEARSLSSTIEYFKCRPELVRLNLSTFYGSTTNPTRDLLERYLKLTHCDLFFADAAILVEGNVERLLLPQMIAKVAPCLQSAYLSILEIGGAFGHRFRKLIEFLGLTTLIVTDIDSDLAPPAGEGALGEDDGAGPGEDEVAGSACMVQVDGAVTSNQTLIQWLPGRTTITELPAAEEVHRTQHRAADGDALIRVTYRTRVEVTCGGRTIALAGRTLDEAFALENLAWCQAAARVDLKLRVRGGLNLTLEQIAERLHCKISSSNFHKTDFALALLAQDPRTWSVPQYIVSGIRWLAHQVTPAPQTQPNGNAQAA
jgi:hypothetical protein